MPRENYCYWTVADGLYGSIFASCIKSARAVGVTADFHAWTDQPIPGAICHDSGTYEFNHNLFKFKFLLKSVRDLAYDYFVFLDADNFFVRDPGDVLRCLQHSPIHVSLESNCLSDNCQTVDWWSMPLHEYARIMRESGVNADQIFNTNAGMWIVHRDAAERMVELAMQFWHTCEANGYTVTEEPPLAYAAHMMTGNPYAHQILRTADLWASDWRGHFQNRLPDGSSWMFSDFFTGAEHQVNPAIVHAMRSKRAMLADARPHRLPLEFSVGKSD